MERHELVEAKIRQHRDTCRTTVNAFCLNFWKVNNLLVSLNFARFSNRNDGVKAA